MKGRQKKRGTFRCFSYFTIKTDHPLRTHNGNTTIIHGWDIQIVSPACGSLKNNHTYLSNFQRKSIIPTQRATFEAKNTGEQQQQTNYPGHCLDAKIVL